MWQMALDDPTDAMPATQLTDQCCLFIPRLGAEAKSIAISENSQGQMAAESIKRLA